MKNLHMLHLEEHAFSEKNFKYIVPTMIEVNEYLRDSSSYPGFLTIKYDGSPAVVFGYYEDRFFVGTKSVFNKTPKMAFSEEEITEYYSTGPIS